MRKPLESVSSPQLVDHISAGLKAIFSAVLNNAILLHYQKACNRFSLDCLLSHFTEEIGTYIHVNGKLKSGIRQLMVKRGQRQTFVLVSVSNCPKFQSYLSVFK